MGIGLEILCVCFMFELDGDAIKTGVILILHRNLLNFSRSKQRWELTKVKKVSGENGGHAHDSIVCW